MRKTASQIANEVLEKMALSLNRINSVVKPEFANRLANRNSRVMQVDRMGRDLTNATTGWPWNARTIPGFSQGNQEAAAALIKANPRLSSTLLQLLKHKVHP